MLDEPKNKKQKISQVGLHPPKVVTGISALADVAKKKKQDKKVATSVPCPCPCKEKIIIPRRYNGLASIASRTINPSKITGKYT